MPATAKALAIREEKQQTCARIEALQGAIMAQSNRPPPAVINGDARLAVHWRELAIDARSQRMVKVAPGRRGSLAKMKLREQALEAMLGNLANPKPLAR